MSDADRPSARLRQIVLPGATAFSQGEAFTLGFAYFTVGLTVAVLHVTDGTSAMVMIASVFLVNSVTPTLAYAAVRASGGSMLAGIASGWLVATRFGLFAAAVAPRLWRSRTKRAAAAHFAFDPNVALSLRETDDADAQRVFVAASFWLCVPWWIGGSIGVFIGDRLGDPARLGLDAVFPAAMLAIIWPQLSDRSLRVVAAAAVVIALLLVNGTPGGVPVLAAALMALWALRGPEVAS